MFPWYYIHMLCVYKRINEYNVLHSYLVGYFLYSVEGTNMIQCIYRGWQTTMQTEYLQIRDNDYLFKIYKQKKSIKISITFSKVYANVMYIIYKIEFTFYFYSLWWLQNSNCHNNVRTTICLWHTRVFKQQPRNISSRFSSICIWIFRKSWRRSTTCIMKAKASMS